MRYRGRNPSYLVAFEVTTFALACKKSTWKSQRASWTKETREDWSKKVNAFENDFRSCFSLKSHWSPSRSLWFRTGSISIKLQESVLSIFADRRSWKTWPNVYSTVQLNGVQRSKKISVVDDFSPHRRHASIRFCRRFQSKLSKGSANIRAIDHQAERTLRIFQRSGK